MCILTSVVGASAVSTSGSGHMLVGYQLGQ
jgi:hypothetical protein